jgi:hypothetical protein
MVTSDDRAGMQPFIVGRIFPAFPQPGKHEWRIVLHAYRVRNFAAENFFPLIGTIARDQAASFLERLEIARRGINGLHPRVDGLVCDFGSLAQFGIRPHRKASRVRCLVSGWRRIARTS